MRDYKVRVTSDAVSKFCDFAVENGIDYEVFEGCLLDNYVFLDSCGMTIKGVKPRKHIIIREVYLNEWSSANELVLTDNTDMVMQFYNNLVADQDREESAYIG